MDDRGEYLNSVEFYDTTDNRWDTAAPLRTGRGGFGCCVVRGSIYVIGGDYEQVYLESIEGYDASINQWTTVNILRSVA